MPSATLPPMMARSGNIKTVPMNPVTVIRAVDFLGTIKGSSDPSELVIVAHARSGPQGSADAIARAAWRVPLGECGGRDDLRRESALAPRPRPQLPRRLGSQPAARCAARGDRPRRGHRHRLGDGSVGAREEPDQEAIA